MRAAVQGGALSGAERDLLGARYGWLGTPPHTLAELAKKRGTTVARLAMKERAALRAALTGAKAGGS